MRPFLIFLLFSASGLKAQELALKWAHSFPTSFVEGKTLAFDDAGNLYMAFTIYRRIDVDPGPDSLIFGDSVGHGILLKLDSKGKLIWGIQVGSSNVRIHALDFQGGLVGMTGTFYTTCDFDPGPGVSLLSPKYPYDAFVLLLDLNGNFKWAKNFGGPGNDYFKTITVDAKKNVLLSGNFYDVIDFDPGPGTFNMKPLGSMAMFYLKLDSAGNFKWAKKLEGIGYIQANHVITDPEGNIFSTGHYVETVDLDPGPGITQFKTGKYRTAFLSKMDDSGRLKWAGDFSSGRSSAGFGLKLDTNNNIFLAGEFQYHMDFDPGSDSFIMTNFGSPNSFIAKYDKNGKFDWAKQMGGYYMDRADAVDIDQAGNIYVMGVYSGWKNDYDPGADSFFLKFYGDMDVFVLKLDNTGNFIYAAAIGGKETELAYGLKVDTAGNVYCVGYQLGDADFDPGPDSFILKCDSFETGTFILKLGPKKIVNSNFTFQISDAIIYPNPADLKCRVVLGKMQGKGQFNLFDMSGKLVHSEWGNAEGIELDIGGLQQGVYMLRASAGGREYWGRVVKM